MINIEVCNYCYQKNNLIAVFMKEHAIPMWANSTDINIKDALLFCPYSKVIYKEPKYLNLSTDNPPTDCPYVLEHILESQK